MEHFEIVIVTLAATFSLFSLFVLWFAKKIYKDASELTDAAAKPLAREKRVLVPGKGIFQTQKPKRRPIYKSEEEIWTQFENEKHTR